MVHMYARQPRNRINLLPGMCGGGKEDDARNQPSVHWLHSAHAAGGAGRGQYAKPEM